MPQSFKLFAPNEVQLHCRIIPTHLGHSSLEHSATLKGLKDCNLRPMSPENFITSDGEYKTGLFGNISTSSHETWLYNKCI